MIGHGARKIVNIGSIAGIAGFAPRPSYGPSKAAVISLTRSLALEWAEYNINVNCVVPGYVRTPMIEEIFKRTGTDVGMIEKRIPFGYLASPDDIANACLFLVSDSARYITGITLPVDGGWLAYGAKSG
jgi:NAD(P)-dependent dehydrogenase (short-subunit alcohol dehydrogenase family)